MPKDRRPSRIDDSQPTPARKRKLGVWAMAMVVLGAVAIWGWIASRAVRPERESTNGVRSSSDQNRFRLEDEKAVFKTYAGSSACRDCHKEAYKLWEDSHHGQAERSPRADWDQSAFDPPQTFRHGTQQSSASWTNGKPHLASLGLSGQRETHAVERVIGHSPLRQFLVAAGEGRLQSLEAAFDPKAHVWFNVYGDEDRRPGEWGHWTGRGMNWNAMCASCHNTRLRKNYDAAADSYRTAMAERSVGCEACHGPSKEHVDWQAQYGRSGRHDPTVAKLSPQQRIDSCGFCHARRNDLTGDFKPGDLFLDHQDLVILDHTDRYYPDGQVHDEDYEYASFLSSRMHARGVTCGDCHEPHSAKPVLPGNWLCMKCHNGSYANAPVIAPVAHSHHKVFGYNSAGVVTNSDLLAYNPTAIRETGGECVNCHMPQTTYMQRHRRHDHGFTIPDPALTQELGIPNACNRCHQDKGTAWAMQAVERWYGPKMVRPSRNRARVIAQARNAASASPTNLLQLLKHEEIPYWRAVALGLLGSWAEDSSVRQALLQHLHDTNALVRAACVRSLEGLANGGTPIADLLRPMLDDPVRDVRISAAWALRSTLSPETQAAAELQHTLDLNADQPTGQWQRGIYHYSRGEFDIAVGHFKKAVAWDPGSPPFRHELAIALSTLGRSREALEQLQAACQLEPLDAETHFKLALAYNETGDLHHTVSELKETVRLQPRHARAWYNLGLAQNELGDATTAVETLLRAESIDASDPQIPFARASVLVRLTRHSEAKQATLRALELRPNYPEARQLLNQLPR